MTQNPRDNDELARSSSTRTNISSRSDSVKSTVGVADSETSVSVKTNVVKSSIADEWDDGLEKYVWSGDAMVWEVELGSGAVGWVCMREAEKNGVVGLLRRKVARVNWIENNQWKLTLIPFSSRGYNNGGHCTFAPLSFKQSIVLSDGGVSIFIHFLGISALTHASFVLRAGIQVLSMVGSSIIDLSL